MTWPPNMRVALGLSDNPLVACACGRETNASMLLDVQALPAAIRGTREWACDGCVDIILRGKRMTRVAFWTALGAPPELLVIAAKKDAADV